MTGEAVGERAPGVCMIGPFIVPQSILDVVDHARACVYQGIAGDAVDECFETDLCSPSLGVKLLHLGKKLVPLAEPVAGGEFWPGEVAQMGLEPMIASCQFAIWRKDDLWPADDTMRFLTSLSSRWADLSHQITRYLRSDGDDTLAETTPPHPVFGDVVAHLGWSDLQTYPSRDGQSAVVTTSAAEVSRRMEGWLQKPFRFFLRVQSDGSITGPHLPQIGKRHLSVLPVPSRFGDDENWVPFRAWLRGPSAWWSGCTVYDVVIHTTVCADLVVLPEPFAFLRL